MAKPKKGAAKKAVKKVAREEEEGKVEEQKDKLLEVDKEWFQIQIRSLEEKLEQRTNHARKLEVSNKEYQERFVRFNIKLIKLHTDRSKTNRAFAIL